MSRLGFSKGLGILYKGYEINHVIKQPAKQSQTTCKPPKYANDEYCDDDSNNADCDWDGGACCNNGLAEWDRFCTECECKGT